MGNLSTGLRITYSSTWRLFGFFLYEQLNGMHRKHRNLLHELVYSRSISYIKRSADIKKINVSPIKRLDFHAFRANVCE